MIPFFKNYFLLIFICFGTIAYSQSESSLNKIDSLFFQKIQLQDGIHLSANIFKPYDISKPLPVILMLTPYVSYFNPEYGPYFAKRGYVFVYVDCRGRGNSEGVFWPFENDAQDGYDVVEWLAKQP